MRRLATITAALLTMLIICSTAYSATIPFEATGPDVRSLQLRLAELGYYTADLSGEFDMPTQAAVDIFCRQNGIPIADGINEATWQTLFSPDASSKQKSTATPQLFPGSTGEVVATLQSRLLELGFYQEEFTAGVYDAATQYAQDRFCIQNRIATQSGATSALQSIILSYSAKEAESESLNTNNATKLTLQESLLTPINVAGFSMPVVVLYGVGILSLALCILLIVVAVRRNRNATHTAANPSRALSDNIQCAVQLNIVYGNHSRTQHCVISGLLPMGRESSGVLLDAKDTGASRQHCDLFYHGSILMLRDHSQSGTYVNGNLVHNDEVAIHNGDSIRISQHTIDIAM